MTTAQGSVRRVTSNGKGMPTGKRHSPPGNIVYGRFVPRGATATGPHGVYPGTGHVAHVNRGVHGIPPVPSKRPPFRPVPRGPKAQTAPPPPRGVGGGVTEVGGFVQQTNAGGTTSGVGGGAYSRGETGHDLGTYFGGVADDLNALGISAVRVAEAAAIIVAAVLVYRHFGRKGRR